MQEYSFGNSDFEIILRQPDGNMPIIPGLKIQILAIST